jgi:hypothetical protein
MDTKSKKIVVISLVTTALAVGGFITYVIIQNKKYKKISENIVSYDEALSLLSEKKYEDVGEVDDVFEANEDFGYEYGLYGEDSSDYSYNEYEY